MSDKNKDKKTPIDVNKIDLERMKLMTSDNKSLEEYATERGSIAFAPNQEGAIKSRAFKVMDEQIEMQMNNIMEQIKVLANQVENLKTRRTISEKIYQSKMSFEPLAGDSYYLYRTEKENILSLLSPKDFGEQRLADKNMVFEAKVKLLADCTWEVLESEAAKITS